MDKWTKIVCLLLALVLTGCSVSRYESSEPAVQQIRQKTTVRLVLTEPDATLLRHAAEEFQQQNDKVTIEIETLPDDAEFPVKIISKLYGEQSPTAFSVHGQTDLTFWRDKLEPVGELSWLHPLKDDLLGPVTQGEAVFGIPLRLTGYGIIYNEPLLDSLEIDHGQIGTCLLYTSTPITILVGIVKPSFLIIT